MIAAVVAMILVKLATSNTLVSLTGTCVLSNVGLPYARAKCGMNGGSENPALLTWFCLPCVRSTVPQHTTAPGNTLFAIASCTSASNRASGCGAMTPQITPPDTCTN